MSNDLISRSELMQSLRNNVLVDVTPNLEQSIEEQPIAYDVDKVIERLEALRQNEIKIVCKPKSHIEEMQACKAHNVLQDAIKIVKSGGIE